MTKTRPDQQEAFTPAPDGSRLYWRRHGAGHPRTAFLTDGLVCDGFIWKYLWDDLTAWTDVVHWNYRGHGRSGAPVDLGRFGVEAHAADLDAIRLAAGDPPAVLMGHSLGVQVCLEAYRLRPQGVLGMVLLCGSFGRVTHTFKGSEILAELLPLLVDWTTRHPRLARSLWGSLPPKAAVRLAQLTGDVDLSQARAEDMEPYFEHVTRVDVDLFLTMLAAAGRHSAQDLLPRIDVPVLIIAGDRDSFTPASLSEAMVEALPRGELLMLAGAGHVAPLEQREAVRARIGDFLAALST